MYLKKWQPVFEPTFGSMHNGDMTLLFEVELECSFCGASEGLQTKGHCCLESVYKKSIDTLLGWKINEIIQYRGCSKCGIVSTLPSADLQRLRDEAQEQITAGRILMESKKNHKGC